VDTDEQRKKVNRYVAISSALHVALFLLFSVGAIFAPRPIVVMPTIHVDMVALPTQVKNNDEPPPDFSKPVGPATPVVEEPKADPDQIAKPEPREATPKPQPVRPAVDEMVLERKKEAEAKKRAEAALKRMRDQLKKERLAEEQKKKAALEKRRADLKAFEQKYRQAVAGNTKNEGNALSGQLAATTDAYSSAVADRIRAHWALPTFLQGQNLKATIVVHIDARGNVVQMEFTRVSGNTLFDNNAEKAIRNSSPVPPPPAELASSVRRGGMVVSFPIDN
jgi:TonB family protein